MRTLVTLSLVSVLACHVEVPLQDGQPPTFNVISGDLVFAAPPSPSGEPLDVAQVVVLAYSADNPGPPAGTGRPVTFTTVPATAFTGDGAGLQAASYAVTNLPDGRYILNGLMDIDGDFNPFVTAMAGATCGDIAGTHLTDLVNQQAAVVEVSGGELKDNVTILLGQRVPLERPAFTFAEPFTASRLTGTDPLAPQQYRLRATGVAANFTEATGAAFPLTLDGPCPLAFDEPTCEASVAACVCDTSALDPCETAFWVQLMDRDGDGEVDLYPAEDQAAAGIRDVWPRVFLTYLGVPASDGSGLEMPAIYTDEVWVSENYPLAVQLVFGDPGIASFPLNTPIPMGELAVTWSPVFRRYHDGGTRTDARGSFDLIDLRAPGAGPDDAPAGAWSVTVMSFTGQTWTLPNELVLTAPADPAFVPAAQGGVLFVE